VGRRASDDVIEQRVVVHARAQRVVPQEYVAQQLLDHLQHEGSQHLRGSRGAGAEGPAAGEEDCAGREFLTTGQGRGSTPPRAAATCSIDHAPHRRNHLEHKGDERSGDAHVGVHVHLNRTLDPLGAARIESASAVRQSNDGCVMRQCSMGCMNHARPNSYSVMQRQPHVGITLSCAYTGAHTGATAVLS